jgi:hypothetical protein
MALGRAAGSLPGSQRAAAQDLVERIGSVREHSIDAQIDERAHVARLVHRPGMDHQTTGVRLPDHGRVHELHRRPDSDGVRRDGVETLLQLCVGPECGAEQDQR